MAVTTTYATAITSGSLLTRIRRAVGDTNSNSNYNRWTDSEIIDAVNLEIAKMAAEWGLGNATQAIVSTTLSYTENADTVALPSGPDVNPIFLVEDYSDSTNPIRLEYDSFLSTNEVNVNSAYKGWKWSRAGSSIALRPAHATTLRIWYLRPPYSLSTAASTDQQPFPVQYEELISIGAAIRLQEVDDEVPPGRIERYGDLWGRFVRGKRQNRGPRYGRSNRRWHC